MRRVEISREREGEKGEYQGGERGQARW